MELHPILERGEWLCKHNLWYVVSARGQHPSMRVGQCCCHIPSTQGGIGKLAVVGGATPSGPFDETHLLDFDQYEWDELELTGFTARYEHASFVAPNDPGKILVFGGAQLDKNLNCVQILDLVSKSWSSVTTKGTTPSPRTCRGSAVDGSKLYIFGGGQQGSEPVSDTMMHVYDAVTSEWTQPPSSGKIPSARHGHVMAVCNGKIYLHGGMSGTSLFDDVYEYSIDTGVWKIVKSKGDIPSGRAAHGCVSHGNKILIFGGMTTGGASDETYMFDTRKSRWLKLKPDGPPPAPRLDHAMCLVTLPCPAQITQSTSNRQNGAEGAAASGSRAPSAGDPSSAAEEFLTSCVETAVEQMSGESPREGSRGGAGAASSTVFGEATLCCLVQGGMDTQGEIFDDCLLLRLDNLL